MVVKIGNKNLRSFKVVAVQNVSGCVTKFKAGRYTGSVPMASVKKAFTRLCNLKRIKNKCTFIITIQDTTNNGNKKGKEYTYKVDRMKLKKPLVMFEGEENEYKILYGVTAKKSGQIEKCKPGRDRTRGRMKKYSRRQEKISKRKQKKTKMTKTGMDKNINNEDNNTNNEDNNTNNENNNNKKRVYYNKNKSKVVKINNKKGNKTKKNNISNNNRMGL